jgi:hypothetical protein
VNRPERQYPRYAHEAAITLIAPAKEISGRTRNVSRGGLCATLSEPLEIGTEVQIDLQLVFDHERHSEALRLSGRIVWCTWIDEHHQVGVQFLALASEVTDDLTMFLRYLDDEQGVAAQHTATTIDERFH